MEKVRQYVGKFTGRFSGMTVTPRLGMEEFLSDFSKGDSVIVFNETDFFKWHNATFEYIDDLKNQLERKKDTEK